MPPTLTDRRVAALKGSTTRAEYFDHTLPGFGVRVTPSGRKSFILLYRSHRRRRRLTFGVYPRMSLAEARGLAREALHEISLGRDPKGARAAERNQTFGALADRYIERYAKVRKKSWRADAGMIRQELDAWSHLPAAAVRRADVRGLLEQIVERGAPVTANRVLSLVRKIFNYGIDQEWLEVNPAHRMARPGLEQPRSRVLSDDELASLWRFLHAPEADPHRRLARAALALRLVTAQRGSEVISLRWADISGPWWTIPAPVAKNRLAHRVPLTGPALAILADLAPPVGGREFVFEGIRGTRQRRGALEGCPVADLQPRDLRRTAASRMAGAGVPRLVIGKVLNHVERGITAVYDRYSYDAEKRGGLEAWAAILTHIIDSC